MPVVHGVTRGGGSRVHRPGRSQRLRQDTVLRMIAGLEEPAPADPDRRRVVNGRAPKERDIAHGVSDYALYPHMTVCENIAFALQLPRASPRRRADSARRGRPRDARHRGAARSQAPCSFPAASASASRWAARSCAIRKVFLFDEPLSNLDAKLREQMRTEIKKLRAAPHHHDLRHARPGRGDDSRRPDRHAERRRIEQVGTPERCTSARPIFVAGFMGSPR